MDQLIEYLPLLIPVVIIELALMITALIHVLKHPNYKFGSKAMWVIFVVLIQIVGPIVYFVFGRGNE